MDITITKAMQMTLDYLSKIEVRGKDNLDYLLGSMQMIERCLKALEENAKQPVKEGETE